MGNLRQKYTDEEWNDLQKGIKGSNTVYLFGEERMEKPKEMVGDLIEVFYVKVNGENYNSVRKIASKMGCSLFGTENFDYSHVIFNLTSEKRGFLPPMHYAFTGRDSHDKIPLVSYIDLENVLTFISTAKEGTEEMSFSYGENLLEKHWNEIAKTTKEAEKGVKYSDEKAPMSKILKQFPLALEAVAFRSKLGHEKYKKHDHDWMNFKRVPNAISEYEDAAIRHFSGIGGDENKIEHLKAAAWNILAALQLTLEEKIDD